MSELTQTQTEYLQWAVARNGLSVVVLLLVWVTLIVVFFKVRKSTFEKDVVFGKTELSVTCVIAMAAVSFAITQNVLGIVKAKTAPRAYLSSYWNTGEVYGVK